MEEKTIYFEVGDCFKEIMVTKELGVTDAECIRHAFNNEIKSDNVLNQLTRGKLIIFKTWNEKIQHLVDVNERTKIPDESRVVVALIDPEPSTSAFSDVSPSDKIRVLATYNEPIISIKEKEILEFVEAAGNKENNRDSLNVINDGEKEKGNLVEGKEDLKENVQNLRADQMITAGKNVTGTRQVQRPRSTKSAIVESSKFHVPYPVNLPILPADLQRDVESDYTNYAKSIIDAYPVLAAPPEICNNQPWIVIKDAISHSIRNRKHYKVTVERKKRSNAEDHSLQPPKSSKKRLSADTRAANQADIVLSKKKSGLENDLADAMVALEKCNPTNYSNHVKRLLQVTYTSRREWIEKEVKLIKEIFVKYPQLQVFSPIMHEFCWMKKIEENKVYESVAQLIENLSLYFKMECKTEEEKGLIIMHLHKQLAGKNQSKVNEPLIIVKQMTTSVKELVTTESTAPRLVIYASDKLIAAARIVAGGEVKVDLSDTSVEKAFACLSAVYHVWHCEYPRGYVNTLSLLDSIILNIPSKLKSIIKFCRDLQFYLTHPEPKVLVSDKDDTAT